MKCLLKLLVVGILGLALLIGGAIALVDPIVQAAVSEGVGYTTNQETTLESADIGLFTGELGFAGLVIKNPPGFQDTPLLRVDSFQTHIAPSKFSWERIEVDLVELNGLDLALELKGADSNVTQLIQRLQELQEQLKPSGGEQPPGDEPTTPGPTKPKKPGPEIGIQKIRIAGVNASLRISDVPQVSGVYKIEVPDLLLEDFSSDMDRATLVEWTAYILEEVLTSALSSGEGVFPSEWQGLLAKGLQDGKLLKGDFSGLKSELKDKAQQELDEVIQGAKEDPQGQLEKSLDKLNKNKEDVKGLFGGKKD